LSIIARKVHRRWRRATWRGLSKLGAFEKEPQMTRGLFLIVGFVCVALISTVSTGGEKAKSIKEVMASHKKDKLRSQIETALKDDNPDWADLQKKTKTYADQAKLLKDFEPPKGDKEDYVKLAKGFSECITNLDKAAKEKDAKAATEAFKKSGTFCGKCHAEHKPK
jgi:hypothetical protein